ncbi:hypothetical protein LZ31DRAFT_238371 [Colletotrichum somersetense]|nr:hypothetical protein LZ31DRAFT_238371 [Colletotrichum somersetense]
MAYACVCVRACACVRASASMRVVPVSSEESECVTDAAATKAVPWCGMLCIAAVRCHWRRLCVLVLCTGGYAGNEYLGGRVMRLLRARLGCDMAGVEVWFEVTHRGLIFCLGWATNVSTGFCSVG